MESESISEIKIKCNAHYSPTMSNFQFGLAMKVLTEWFYCKWSLWRTCITMIRAVESQLRPWSDPWWRALMSFWGAVPKKFSVTMPFSLLENERNSPFIGLIILKNCLIHSVYKELYSYESSTLFHVSKSIVNTRLAQSMAANLGHQAQNQSLWNRNINKTVWFLTWVNIYCHQSWQCSRLENLHSLAAMKLFQTRYSRLKSTVLA